MAARWVVIGTALAAAATASYMLMSPGQRGSGPDDTSQAGSGSGGVPQEKIDAESRDAMREFLRQSVQEDAAQEEAVEKAGESDW